MRNRDAKMGKSNPALEDGNTVGEHLMTQKPPFTKRLGKLRTLFLSAKRYQT